MANPPLYPSAWIGKCGLKVTKNIPPDHLRHHQRKNKDVSQHCTFQTECEWRHGLITCPELVKNILVNVSGDLSGIVYDDSKKKRR